MGVFEEIVSEVGLAGVSGSGIESEMRTWIEIRVMFIQTELYFSYGNLNLFPLYIVYFCRLGWRYCGVGCVYDSEPVFWEDELFLFLFYLSLYFIRKF